MLLSSVTHWRSVDVLLRLLCLFVYATCCSLACSAVEMSSRPSQYYTQTLLSLFFQKIGWEKSKVEPYKIGSFHQSLSLPVQLEHMLQYRTHRISCKGCFAIDNDGSATPALSLLVKSWPTMFWIEQPFSHLFTAHLQSDTFLSLPQAPGVSRHSFLWYN